MTFHVSGESGTCLKMNLQSLALVSGDQCSEKHSTCQAVLVAQLKTPMFSVLIVHVYYWILPRSRTCEKGLVLRFTNMCFVFLCKNTPTWSLN